MNEQKVKEATVYSSEGCVACTQVIRALKDSGYSVTVMDAATAAASDREVKTELELRGNVLPVVNINGDWASPAQIIANIV